MQRIQSNDCRVLILIAAGGAEESKGRVVTQTKIQSEAGTNSPGVLKVQSKPLHTLRKRSVAGGNEFAAGREIRGKFSRVGDIERRVLWKFDQGFRIVGQPAAEHRFVNEVRAELNRM